MNNDLFLSCDWGTTNFRLRLIQRGSLEIKKEHESAEGVKWSASQAIKLGKKKEDFYSDFLSKKLEHHFADFENVPLICTGMLSSNLGIRELPYAQVPIESDGNGLLTEVLELNNGRKFILVSGVRSELGFMRGEEIQAVGLAEHLHTEGILMLPGTHSKHIEYRQNKFVEIKNFMTGELFEMLSNYSILSGSVARDAWSDQYTSAFIKGVKSSVNEGLSPHLLQVRANDLFSLSSEKENYYFLSGLLIGDEISGHISADEHIYMAAGGTTFPLYELALKSVINEERLTFFDESKLLKALFEGQKKVIENYGW